MSTRDPDGDFKSYVKSTELRAVVTRANGDVEDLGLISFSHRNPLRVGLWKLGRLFGQTWGVPK